MDTIRRFDLMEKIVHELEDLKNSQEALIKKLSKIEVDNIDLGDRKLEKDLPDMHERVAANLDTVTEILAYFAEKTNEFSSKNNVSALKEQEDIDNI